MEVDINKNAVNTATKEKKIMKEVKHIVKDPMGIHARPAGMLVKEAGKFTSAITIEANGKSADAKKIFGIMGLGVKVDANLVLKIDGPDESEAASALETFLKNNL